MTRLTSTTDDVQPLSTSVVISKGVTFKVIDLLTSSANGPSIVNFELKTKMVPMLKREIYKLPWLAIDNQ